MSDSYEAQMIMHDRYGFHNCGEDLEERVELSYFAEGYRKYHIKDKEPNSIDSIRISVDRYYDKDEIATVKTVWGNLGRLFAKRCDENE